MPRIPQTLAPRGQKKLGLGQSHHRGWEAPQRPQQGLPLATDRIWKDPTTPKDRKLLRLHVLDGSQLGSPRGSGTNSLQK